MLAIITGLKHIFSQLLVKFYSVLRNYCFNKWSESFPAGSRLALMIFGRELAV